MTNQRSTEYEAKETTVEEATISDDEKLSEEDLRQAAGGDGGDHGHVPAGAGSSNAGALGDPPNN